MCGFFYFCEWYQKKDQNPLKEYKSLIFNSLMERGNTNYNEKEFHDENRYIYTAHSLLPIFGDTQTKYPIESDDSSLLFNGQVYSINENLIKNSDFKNDGFALKSYLDIDGKNNFYSILNLLIEVSGQFAFVYSNKISNIILLARDISGQKPLYFLKTKNCLIVSSVIELVGLFSSLSKDKIIQTRSFSLPYRESKIEKLPPGGIAIFDLNKGNLTFSSTVYSYFKLFIQKPSFINKKSLIKEYFFKSLEEIIPKDNNFCLALSGGYDSTNIAIGLKELGLKPKQVFTIQNKINKKDVKIAKDLCDNFNWPIKIIKPLSSINKLKYSSIPSDPAALSIASIAYNTQPISKIVLSGDGGDEISRRYRRFVYYRFPLNLFKLIYDRNYNYIFDLLSKRYSLKRLELFSIIALKADKDNLASYSLYKNHIEHLDPALIYEVIYNLPERILSKTDIISYNYGVEFRSPFLSPRIYSLTLDLNNNFQKLNFSKVLAKILNNSYPLNNKKYGLA